MDTVDHQKAPASAWRGVAYGLLAATIWGAFAPFTRHAITSGLTAADIAFIRFTVAGVIMTPLLASRVWRHGLEIDAARAAVLCLLAGPPFILVGAHGYRFAPVVHGAVIQMGVLALAGIGLSAWLTGDRLWGSRLAGVGVLLAGLILTAGAALYVGGSQAWKGDLLFALAGLMFAVFTVLIRRWRIDAWSAAAVVSVASGLVYAPLYLVTEDH